MRDKMPPILYLLSYISCLISYLSVMYPYPVIQHGDCILFQVSCGGSLDWIAAIVENVLGTTDLAGGDGIAALDDPRFTGIGFYDTECGPFQRTTGIVGIIVLVANANHN